MTAGANNTSTATSASFTPTSTGTWCFAAVYSGDTNYTASCRHHHRRVLRRDVGVDPTVTAPTSSSIVLGTGNTDGATVTGNAAGGSPTGTVTFYECGPTSSPTACTSTANQVGSAVGVTAGGRQHRHGHLGLLHAHLHRLPGASPPYYSGDTNYTASSDTTTDECFDVTAAHLVDGHHPDLLDHRAGRKQYRRCGRHRQRHRREPDRTPSASMPAGRRSARASVHLEGRPGGQRPWASPPGPATRPRPHRRRSRPPSAGTWCFAAVYSGDTNYATQL